MTISRIDGGTTNDFRSWDELEEAIKRCTRCPLHRTRKNAVPGEGDRNAKVMLIGEAPGATEDEMGRPFVGAAGKLLTMTLESVGIPRPSVYITNVVKCRPPGNREPNEDEIAACSPFLEAQILMLRPRIIVTLGNIAGKWIFEKAGLRWSGVTKMRGRIYNLSLLGLQVIVLPTLHPAAALYNPSVRNLFVEDIKRLKELLDIITTKGMEAVQTSQTPSTITRKSLFDYVRKR